MRKRICLFCGKDLPDDCHGSTKFCKHEPAKEGDPKKISCKQKYHSEKKKENDAIYRDLIKIHKKNHFTLKRLSLLADGYFSREELLASGVELDFPIKLIIRNDKIVLLFLGFELITRSGGFFEIKTVRNSNILSSYLFY